MAQIEIKNITKNFSDSAFCIRPIDLCIEKGQKLALLGHAGSGKTTLLKLIGGLIAPSGGEVLIEGEQPKLNRNSDIAMYFEDFSLFGSKTLEQNLAYPLKIRRMDKGEVDKRVQIAAEVFFLSTILKKRAFSLSPVKRNIAALARIYARSPKIILIDEPPEDLTAQQRLEVMLNIKKLIQKSDATIVAAFSLAHEAINMCDKIAVMHSGGILQTGSIEELKLCPANPFVDFILK